MPLTLVVVEPFGEYERGEVITDSDEIARVRTSENAARVVQASDEVVPPPPTDPVPSPLQGVINELALLKQRVAELEEDVANGGGGTDPGGGPGPIVSQPSGALLTDKDGTVPADGDGTVLTR